METQMNENLSFFMVQFPRFQRVAKALPNNSRRHGPNRNNDRNTENPHIPVGGENGRKKQRNRKLETKETERATEQEDAIVY